MVSMATTKRAMPYSEEAERAVIGACLLDESDLAYAASDLSPDDFYNARHKEIFKCLCSLFDAGIKPDAVTILELSKKHLDKPIRQEETASFIDTWGGGSVKHYGRILKAHATQRNLIVAAEKIYKLALSDKDPAHIAAAKALDLVAAADVTKRSSDGSLSRYFDSDEAELERWSEGEEPPEFRLGIPDVDDVFEGGILPGQLMYIVGGQGSMKTSLALHAIKEYINRTNQKVCLFSLDMSGEEIKDRLLAAHAKVTPKEARKMKLDDPDRYIKHRSEIETLYRDTLKVYDDTRTFDAIRKVIVYERPYVVAIDFITAVDVPELKMPSDYHKLSIAEANLRRWKTEFPNVVWVILNQMSEISKGLQNKGDIGAGRGRGGGALTNIAHVGIELYKDAGAALNASYGEDATPWLVATIFKNRLGVEKQNFRLHYNGPTMTFLGGADRTKPIKQIKAVFSA